MHVRPQDLMRVGGCGGNHLGHRTGCDKLKRVQILVVSRLQGTLCKPALAGFI